MPYTARKWHEAKFSSQILSDGRQDCGNANLPVTAPSLPPQAAFFTPVRKEVVMLLSHKKQSGNALKGVMALLLAMAIIVSSPLWFNILVSSNESQSKVACMNLEIAKKNHAAYAKSVNECMADNKAVENQAYFLNECRRFAQKKYPISQNDFPALSVFGLGDTRAYTEARANGCGQ